MVSVNVLQPISISTILIGAMMPYAFSALTMQSVGSAAAEMVLLINKLTLLINSALMS